jgi:hypothetical protein
VGKPSVRMSRLRAAVAMRVVVDGQPASDVRESVLLCAHGHAICDGEHVAHDGLDAAGSLARLAALDEPRVLGEPASVDDQWLAEAPGDRCRGADVGEAHRLAAAGVVGDGEHHDRHALARLFQQSLEPFEIDVALERVQDRPGRVPRGRHEIDGLGAPVASMFPRVVSKWVFDGISLPGPPTIENRMASAARPWWVRNDVLERHQLAHRRLETIEGRRTRVRLVATHDGAPLFGAHRAGA